MTVTAVLSAYSSKEREMASKVELEELTEEGEKGRDSEALHSLLQSVTGERDALRRDVQQLCAASSRQGFPRDGLRQRLSHAHAQLESARDAHEARTHEVAVLRAQARSMLEGFNSAAQHARTLQQQKEASEAENERLRARLSSAQAHPPEALTSQSHFHSQIPTHSELSSLNDEVARLRTQLSAATNELQAERARRRAFHDRIERGASYASSSSACTDQLESPKQPQLIEQDSTVESLSATFSNQSSTAIDTLQEEIQNLREQVSSFAKERDEFRLQLATAVQEKVEALLLWQQEQHRASELMQSHSSSSNIEHSKASHTNGISANQPQRKKPEYSNLTRTGRQLAA
jgi:chromosome segregation ATPase